MSGLKICVIGFGAVQKVGLRQAIFDQF